MAVWLLAAACNGSPVGTEEAGEHLPDVSTYVTGDAVRFVDAKGNFTFPEPSLAQWGGLHGPLEARRVLDLAAANIASGSSIAGGSPLRELIEIGHGQPVNWEAVQLSDTKRLLFGEAAYQPDTGVPATLRNVMGPHYFAVLVARSEAVAAVSLAAASGLYVEGNVLRRDGDGGNEIFTTGIHHSSAYRVPVEPEVATIFAAEATQSRVAGLPVLILAPYPSAPMAARWRLVLEERKRLRRLSDGSILETDTIYVSQAFPHVGSADARLRIMVPAETQPMGDQIVLDGVSYEFVRRPSIPLDFEEAELVW